MYRSLKIGLPSLLLGVAACASVPKSPPDLLLVDEGLHVGTVLSGSLVETPPAGLDWGGSWMLQADIAYVTELPAGGVPLTGRVVVVDGAPHVFGVHAELAGQVRVAANDGPVSDAEWARRITLALPAGATASLHAELGEKLARVAAPVWDSWGFEVSRSAQQGEHVEAAFLFDGHVVPRVERYDEGDEDEPALVSSAPVRVRERVILDVPPAPGGKGLRFMLPAPTREARRGGVTIAVRLLTYADAEDGFEGEIARGRELAEAEHARARAAARALDETEGFRFESGTALAALGGRELQRPALVFLAQSTGATVTEELALVAAAETLAEFLVDVQARTAALEVAPTGARSFGWFLERSAYLWMCTCAEDEKRALEPALFAVLARHVGELARYPDLLREALVACANADEFAEALARENRIFLEDAHPAARVRAYDWLAARGEALAEFDPLAGAVERRAVLARLADEAEAAAEVAGEDGDE